MPIVVALRQTAQGRLILRGVGLPRDPPPVSHGSMVVPTARTGATAVGFEQGRHRLVGRFAHVEMRRHPSTAVVAEYIVRDSHDLGPVSIENCDSQIGERQDPSQQWQVDPTSRRLDASHLRLVEAQRDPEIPLAQIAYPPHAHHDPWNVDPGGIDAIEPAAVCLFLTHFALSTAAASQTAPT